MPRFQIFTTIVLAWVILAGVVVQSHLRSACAAEPDRETAATPGYTPSIPATFLDASLPFDPTTMPRNGGHQSGPAARPSSTDVDAAITAQLLEGRERGHHFPTLPPEEILAAAMPAAMPMPPQAMSPPPTPSDIVAAQLQAAPPPTGHHYSNLPFDDNNAFPLYQPGLSPPRYPGELVQFQQPSPYMADSSEMFGAVPPGAFQQRRAELNVAGGERPRGAWVASVEAVFFTDTTKVAGPALVQNVTTQATLLTAPQIPDSWGVGPRVTLTRVRSQNVAFDIGYLGIFNWDREADLFSTNNLQLAGPIALASIDFFGADAMNVLYRTTINSVESNLILTPDWAFPVGSFVVGSRMIQWKEKLDISATDFDSGTSDYIVRTTNRMYGGQFGWNGDIDSPIGGALLVKLRGGVFMTHSAQAQTIYDFDNTFELRNAGGTNNRVSYLGEASLVQSFNPLRGLDVRFGYTLMWINGLTRAPDQVDMSDTLTSGSAVIDTGHVFLHGFNLTVAYGW